MQSSSNMSLSKAGEPIGTVSKIAQGPVEHQTSHSERSLLDLLGCEEKEVNLEQSVGDLEATTNVQASVLQSTQTLHQRFCKKIRFSNTSISLRQLKILRIPRDTGTQTRTIS